MKNQGSWKKWLTLIIVSMAGGAIYRLPYLRETYYLALGEASGATNAQLGLLMSAYAIANFALYFPGGWMADRFSPKKLIAFSTISTGALGFYFATFPSFPMLVVIHAVWAITTVFTFWPTMIKIVRCLGDSAEQGRLFGFLEFGRGAISTILAFISVPIFSKLGEGVMGLRGTIIFYSCSLIVIGILAILFIEDKKDENESSRVVIKGMFSVLKMPSVWLASMLIFTGFSIFIGFGMVTPYLTEVFGMSESVAATVSVIRAYVLMSAGAIVAGFIADKIGSRIRLMLFCFMGVILFTFVYRIMPGNPGLISLVVGNLVVLGMFVFAGKAMFFSTIDEIKVPAATTGIAAGFMSLVGYLPETFMYTWVGKMLDDNPGIQGYRNIFTLMIVLGVIGFICAALLLKINKDKKTQISAS